MVQATTNSPRARKKSGDQLPPAPKKTNKTKAMRFVNIKKAICKRKMQEISEIKRRAQLSSSAQNKDSVVDEEADEKSREAKQLELATFIEDLENKYQEAEEQKHKLFMLLKFVLAEDEKKKQQEMQEKKILEQKRAEEAAQLALTAPKEEQRRPNYYSHGHDTYNRGPTTPPHQFLSNNPRNNAGMGMHGNKPVNSQPFTGLVPPALQHLTAQQFHRRREPPLLKDPPHPFFGTGFIGANPHLGPMGGLPRMLPPVQAQALAMQIQQGLALPQLLHNSFANPHMRLQGARGDPRNHPAQRGRVYW